MFAMASLCVTENIHIFNRRKIQIVLRRSARKDRLRNEGAVRNAEDVGRFFVMLGVSVGAIALGLYVSMWSLLGYSITFVWLSVIQVVVTFIPHGKLDD